MSDRFKEFNGWERGVIAEGLIQQAKQVLNEISGTNDPDFASVMELLDLAKEAAPKDE